MAQPGRPPEAGPPIGRIVARRSRKGCLLARSRSALHRGPHGGRNPRFAFKEGSTKMAKGITICAGIDTGKYKLDIALEGASEQLQVDNTLADHNVLADWLRRQRGKARGIE